MSEILVIGGTTFVSRCLAQYLIGVGHDVDLLTRGEKEVKYEGYREHLICDRRNKEQVEVVFKDRKYEYIFDISAYTKQDVEIITSAMNKQDLKKYIFCSSGAVYKPSLYSVSEEDETGENPNWGQYGLDKLEAENYIINTGIPYAILRPSYIYGEHNNIYREAYLFDRIKRNKPIPVPYGKETMVQFIHIQDLVRVFASAMYSSNNKGIYNVTHPECIAWEDLINTAAQVVGNRPFIKRVQGNTYSTRRYFPFRDITYKLNIQSLITDGLHIPSINLEEGLKRTYKWYIESGIQLMDKGMDKVEDVIKINDSNYQ